MSVVTPVPTGPTDFSDSVVQITSTKPHLTG
jgi:hypothetical protein